MGLLSKAVIGTPNSNSSSEQQEKALMEIFSDSLEKFGMFHGLVIEAVKYSAGEFISRLSSMVSGFGITRGLTPGRVLVLFSSTYDSELIGKHLAKTVPGNNVFSFQANNPKEALSYIKPYL